MSFALPLFAYSRTPQRQPSVPSYLNCDVCVRRGIRVSCEGTPRSLREARRETGWAIRSAFSPPVVRSGVSRWPRAPHAR